MVLSKDLKIAICFGLIIGVIVSVCNLCFASEDSSEVEVPLSIVPNLYLSTSTMEFTTSSSQSVGYFSVIPGATYRIYNTAGSTRTFAYTNEIPAVGVDVLDSFTIPAGGSSGASSYITIPEGVNYLFLTTSFSQQNTWIYLVDEGLPNFVYRIANELSFVNLNNILTLVVPILAISVLFGLGFYFIRRIINKIKKKKGGI